MKRNIKSIVALLLLFSVLLSVLVLPVSALPKSELVSSLSGYYNSGNRDTECTSLSTQANNYYTGEYSYSNLSGLKNDALLQKLRTLTTSTHHKNSSYNDCRDFGSNTDCSDGKGNVVLLYTNGTSTQSGHGGSWNKEHVWPKSLGGYETSGPGADLHHIRPSDNRVNSIRGNDKFGEGGTKEAIGGNAASGMLGGYTGNSYFEPLDFAKGDVARICLYMYVRYGGMSQYTCDKITNVFESVDVLLKWCALDPVDTWEMSRNDIVEKYQGNRNVFIDYPELAWNLFGKTAPSDMTTPSGGSGSGGSGDTTCRHSSTEIRNKVSATCGESGYTGDTYCTACGEKIATGTAISATGRHTWGELVVVTPATETTTGVGKKTCTVCDATTTETIPVIVPPCEHENTEIRNKVAATCGAMGYTGDTYCVDCNEKLSSGSSVLATGQHAFGGLEVITPPTVNSTGTGKMTCAVCGATKTESIPAIDPDCNHTNTEYRNVTEATCHTPGYTGDVYCSDCGYFIEAGESVPATGDHKWGEPVRVEPTEDKAGSEKKTCTVCGEESVTTIPKIEKTEREKLNELIASLGGEEQVIILIHLGIIDKSLYELILG
ncbi:MAG: endonuclease [Clostridia bacterium]|nr:endonuclease [Clostridia bacterium]